MGQDNQNHLVSQVVGGQIEQSDVEVKNVTITSMSEETVQGATIARGTALVTIDKLYSAAELAGAKDGALAAECHLLSQSEAGERPGPHLPAVRDDQSARIDHHRVPREPDVRRSHRARCHDACRCRSAPQPATEESR